jgi:hypothetical protein
MTMPACAICVADDLRPHYPLANDYITGTSAMGYTDEKGHG